MVLAGTQNFRHVSGMNSTSMGKISRRPASISKISTSFAGSAKQPKFCIGPAISKPGPMLFRVAATAVKFRHHIKAVQADEEEGGRKR